MAQEETLPSPWIREFDPTYNQVFYVNPTTNPPTRQWNHPSLAPGQAAPEQQVMLQAAPPAQSQGSQLPYTEDQQRQGLSGSNNDATKGWGSNAMYAGGGAVAATLLGKMFSGSQHHGSNGGLLSSLFGGKSNHGHYNSHGMGAPPFMGGMGGMGGGMGGFGGGGGGGHHGHHGGGGGGGPGGFGGFGGGGGGFGGGGHGGHHGGGFGGGPGGGGGGW